METVAHLTTDPEKAMKFGSPSQARYAGEKLVAGTPHTVEAKLGKKIVCQINVAGVSHFIAEEPTTEKTEEVTNG